MRTAYTIIAGTFSVLASVIAAAGNYEYAAISVGSGIIFALLAIAWRSHADR